MKMPDENDLSDEYSNQEVKYGRRRVFVFVFIALAVITLYRFSNVFHPTFTVLTVTLPGTQHSNEYTTTSPIKPESVNVQLHDRLRQAADNTKVILLWGWPDSYPRYRSEHILGTLCGSCVITRNKSTIYEKNTAAVVFNYKFVQPGKMPPKSARRPDHLFVWHTGESPVSLVKGRNMNFIFEDQCKFNVTMMLRRDSDISVDYGNAVSALKRARRNLRNKYHGNLRNILKNKTNFAVSVTSNCVYAAAEIRLHLLYRLLSLIKLDALGRCFHRPFPKTGVRSDDMQILQKYKFYFAFENSYHCRDYITEKFFVNALGIGVLPIVWGPKREDYEAVAPPNSFIHVDDFESLEKLIQYMKYLDQNDTAYLEYFRWYLMKDKDMPGSERQTSFCQLCRIVHGINVDDRFSPRYDPDNPQRPLFTNGVWPRTLPPMRQLIIATESKECFKTLQRGPQKLQTRNKPAVPVLKRFQPNNGWHPG